jgi:hypothetical protein
MATSLKSRRWWNGITQWGPKPSVSPSVTNLQMSAANPTAALAGQRSLRRLKLPDLCGLQRFDMVIVAALLKLP